MSGEENTVCNGVGCDHSGPSILINEVMLCPYSGDGSIYGPMTFDPAGGEWIELYNPDRCKSVDISCYFLGNNAWDNQGGSGDFPGGFSIPPGTVVPPQGFVVVRGANATPVPSHLLVANGGKTIEIVVDSRVCLGGGVRLWFPNAGGWFAFYDANGIPQDAISWANQTNSCMSCNPCNPTAPGCSFPGVLPSYNDIPAEKKKVISQTEPTMGRSFRRIPDGGAWATNQPGTPTLGTCNSICNEEVEVTCNGSVTVTASGGTPPYSYVWNDGKNQTTATATGLCAREYCVTVTDALHNTQTACYTVQNYIPVVSHEDLHACANETSFLLAGGNPPEGNYSGTGVVNNIFTIYDDSEFYALTYTYSTEYECTNSANFLLHILPVPQIEFDFPDSICQKDPARLQLHGNTEPLDFTLSKNGAPILTTHLQPFTNQHYELFPETDQAYSLNITAASGCSNHYHLEIVVMPKPVADFIADPSIILFSEYVETYFQNITTQADPANITWHWDFGDGAGSSALRDPVYVYQDFGDFDVTLSATSSFGCFDKVTHKIILEETLAFPNVMTINGDGINDVFAIRNLDPDKENVLFIYDRWGRKVFEAKNYKTFIKDDILYNIDTGFKGEELSNGTYYFVFNYKGILREINYHGSLTLIK